MQLGLGVQDQYIDVFFQVLPEGSCQMKIYCVTLVQL